MSSAEYEQVRQAVQPVLDASNDHVAAHLAADNAGFDSIEDSFSAVERAAMLAVVDARQDEHHRWDIVGPPDCPRCAELAALRKEIEDA